MNVHVAVISARRPQAVQEMARFWGYLADQVRWYVAAGEGADYTYGGAEDVVEAGDLVAARNLALEDAFAKDMPCLQVSDDLSRLQLLPDMEGVGLDLVAEQMADALHLTPDAHLAGVAPTANKFFGKLGINDHGFCVGDLILVAPTPLRFDPEFPLREDYAYTAQHLAAYGKVARLDWVMATFQHRSNAGGVKIYRTPELEQATIARLIARWPNAFRLNPKRPDEVLFRWQAPAPEGMFA